MRHTLRNHVERSRVTKVEVQT